MSFAAYMNNIVKSLQSRPEQQYKFIGGLFAVAENPEFEEVRSSDYHLILTCRR